MILHKGFEVVPPENPENDEEAPVSPPPVEGGEVPVPAAPDPAEAPPECAANDDCVAKHGTGWKCDGDQCAPLPPPGDPELILKVEKAFDTRFALVHVTWRVANLQRRKIEDLYIHGTGWNREKGDEGCGKTDGRYPLVTAQGAELPSDSPFFHFASDAQECGGGTACRSGFRTAPPKPGPFKKAPRCRIDLRDGDGSFIADSNTMGEWKPEKGLWTRVRVKETRFTAYVRLDDGSSYLAVSQKIEIPPPSIDEDSIEVELSDEKLGLSRLEFQYANALERPIVTCLVPPDAMVSPKGNGDGDGAWFDIWDTCGDFIEGDCGECNYSKSPHMKITVQWEGQNLKNVVSNCGEFLPGSGKLDQPNGSSPEEQSGNGWAVVDGSSKSCDFTAHGLDGTKIEWKGVTWSFVCPDTDSHTRTVPTSLGSGD